MMNKTSEHIKDGFKLPKTNSQPKMPKVKQPKYENKEELKKRTEKENEYMDLIEFQQETLDYYIDKYTKQIELLVKDRNALIKRVNDLKKQIKEKDVFYLCDRKKCKHCSIECLYTTDINHAINFIDGISGYFEEIKEECPLIRGYKRNEHH